MPWIKDFEIKRNTQDWHLNTHSKTFYKTILREQDQHLHDRCPFKYGSVGQDILKTFVTTCKKMWSMCVCTELPTNVYFAGRGIRALMRWL